MNELLPILAAAVLVEGIVTIIRNLKDPDKDWKYWVSLVVSLLVSILVVYNWELDLFSAILGVGLIPLVGIVLTGNIVSRGSNYVADLIKLLGATTERVRNGI